eukprot:EG_transcript_57549
MRCGMQLSLNLDVQVWNGNCRYVYPLENDFQEQRGSWQVSNLELYDQRAYHKSQKEPIHHSSKWCKGVWQMQSIAGVIFITEMQKEKEKQREQLESILK